jgi:hypothetical protein
MISAMACTSPVGSNGWRPVEDAQTIAGKSSHNTGPRGHETNPQFWMGSWGAYNFSHKVCRPHAYSHPFEPCGERISQLRSSFRISKGRHFKPAFRKAAVQDPQPAKYSTASKSWRTQTDPTSSCCVANVNHTPCSSMRDCYNRLSIDHV